MDGVSAPLVAEFDNEIFTEDDIKKIKADNRLAVLVLSDPKRVKRCDDQFLLVSCRVTVDSSACGLVVES